MNDSFGKLTAYLARIPSVLGIVFRNRDLRRGDARVCCVHRARVGHLDHDHRVRLQPRRRDHGGGRRLRAAHPRDAALAAGLGPRRPASAGTGARPRVPRERRGGARDGHRPRSSTPTRSSSMRSPRSSATACSLIRPPLYALVPTLARTPYELTAANVTTGWVESVTRPGRAGGHRRPSRALGPGARAASCSATLGLSGVPAGAARDGPATERRRGADVGACGDARRTPPDPGGAESRGRSSSCSGRCSSGSARWTSSTRSSRSARSTRATAGPAT